MTDGESASRGPFMRQLSKLAGKAKTSLALVGFATLAASYFEYKRLYPEDKDDGKKKVLVIPFHRLKVLEKASAKLGDKLSDLNPDSDDKSIKLELKELIDTIHHAASDPDIVALYGIFGHGSQLPQSTSFAELEEIRNALRVFRESHRRHSEPNLAKEMQIIPRIEPKPLYAYADTFASLGDPSNKEYYLASIFTHIHMQNQGELNLFGPISENFFLRGLLEKYGITLHVFKHGEYKNFPNMFTEKGFTRAHRENVSNILFNIHEQVCDDITRARQKTLAGWLSQGHIDVWKRIQSGTFTASTAWKAGLLDFLPRRDPLPELIEAAKSEENLKALKENWDLHEIDADHFKAEKVVTLSSYVKKLRTKKEAEERKEAWSKYLSQKTSSEVPGRESIALVHVTGPIGDAAARKFVNTIRKIGKDKDTKCLLVRVASPGGSIFACETISQELQALKIPVVFSFGSVAASGGYYIASNADRIFSSGKSVTGSIGVFAMRLDLTGLAAKYGISTQAIASGDLSGSYSPFVNMSSKMKQNMAASVDRYYSQFKNRVAAGRNIPASMVEQLAQGRVWTGEQAKENGLVDEVGGLHRALAYAQRTFTESKDAKVVAWPKESFFDRLLQAKEDKDTMQIFGLVREYLVGGAVTESVDTSNLSYESLVDRLVNGTVSEVVPPTLTSMLACDEQTAVRLLLQEAVESQKRVPSVPKSFWI